jgi:hypothetical protein
LNLNICFYPLCSAAVKSRVLLSIPAVAYDTCPDTKHALRRDYAWAPVADELDLESLPIMPSEGTAGIGLEMSDGSFYGLGIGVTSPFLTLCSSSSQ